MTEITIILGTRPEIIKLSPIIRGCQRRDIPFSLVHTGQHYSEKLDDVFFENLGLPVPDYNLDVGSKSHGKQTGEMVIKIEELLLEEEPEVVVVQGDTNSVLAGGIAASKIEPELAHVEAGLRSYDRTMPEETNRVIVDHVADYLFAPTENARKLLHEEGVSDERIYVTGNTIVDAVFENEELASSKSRILSELGVSGGEFILMTAHRAENVDDPERLADILDGVARVTSEFGLPALYPVHPRTRKSIEKFDVQVPPSVELIEPLDFLDFLKLESNAALAITDSGGVQEETCILGTPCVTVRDSTERPETVEVGANVVVGTDPDDILSEARRMLRTDGDWTNPFGDGTAAERILDTVSSAT